MSAAPQDPGIPSRLLLRDFFARSPAALRATRMLKSGAQVDLELEGEEPAHFASVDGKADIQEGPGVQPDFVLRLPRRAVEELTQRVEDDVGQLGVEFLKLLLERDPSLRVRVHLHASLPRLVAHGYLSVLALGGLKVALWLAKHGVRNPSAVIERLRHAGPVAGPP